MESKVVLATLGVFGIGRTTPAVPLEPTAKGSRGEIHSGESGLATSNRCFQITLSPQEDEADESSTPVQLALIFSHTEKYPDEPPLLSVKSLRGIRIEDLRILKEKLQQEASEILGMAMVYTLVTSAQEWLSEQFGQDTSIEDAEAEVAATEDIVIPHGEPVTIDTFMVWRERFEAELALERAKLMPESALTAPKEKKLSGRQWFESGRAAANMNDVGKLCMPSLTKFYIFVVADDEEDMLEHYLAEKTDSSSHSSMRA
ncbi:hypothetical protein FH972_003607 [Carpinus fangiana]|uniref:RWD domain-containing protein n=1 Tax=Carpinus fangiana TaxID=176857 RepID=A0A5N6QJ05_9ROSI|nr:hypothetical protein FH972_003607 [Carpinus fangiana]